MLNPAGAARVAPTSRPDGGLYGHFIDESDVFRQQHIKIQVSSLWAYLNLFTIISTSLWISYLSPVCIHDLDCFRNTVWQAWCFDLPFIEWWWIHKGPSSKYTIFPASFLYELFKVPAIIYFITADFHGSVCQKIPKIMTKRLLNKSVCIS